jgi:ferredoxin
MKKVIINKEKCRECGLCVGVDPESFERGGDGKVCVKKHPHVTDKTMSAARMCPQKGIVIEEEE